MPSGRSLRCGRRHHDRSTCIRSRSRAVISRFVCVGTCHFPQGGCLGSIMLIDYRKGVRVHGPDPDKPEFRYLDPTLLRRKHHAARVCRSGDRTGLAFPTGGWQIRARHERTARPPVYASFPDQRSRVSGVLQGESGRSLQGSRPTPMRSVSDGYWRADIGWCIETPALLLASRCPWSLGPCRRRSLRLCDPRVCRRESKACAS